MLTILDADFCEESLRDAVLNDNDESNAKALPSRQIPAGIYIFKVNDGNARTICKICSKLAIKTPEQRQLRRSSVFIVNWIDFTHCSGVCDIDVEQLDPRRETSPYKEI